VQSWQQAFGVPLSGQTRLARPYSPHGIFFSKSPPTEKVSANAVTERTLRCQVRPRGCCCANVATCSPAVFACLLFTSSDHDIAPCSVLVEGRATVTTAALSWLHQRHCVCAASAALFARDRFHIRCRTLSTALSGSLFAVTCGQRSQARRSASCRVTPPQKDSPDRQVLPSCAPSHGFSCCSHRRPQELCLIFFPA
jgi:hypothetical protein